MILLSIVVESIKKNWSYQLFLPYNEK